CVTGCMISACTINACRISARESVRSTSIQKRHLLRGWSERIAAESLTERARGLRQRVSADRPWRSGAAVHRAGAPYLLQQPPVDERLRWRGDAVGLHLEVQMRRAPSRIPRRPDVTEHLSPTHTLPRVDRGEPGEVAVEE